MNKLLAISGIAILVMGLFVLLRDPGHIPLLDANRTVLAETNAEGYCAGITYVRTGGRGNDKEAALCRKDNEVKPTEIDYAVVQHSFCMGYHSLTAFSVGECVQILKGQELWPTMAGALSNEWNDRFPYPGDRFISGGNVSDSRTGDRDENERDEIQR